MRGKRQDQGCGRGRRFGNGWIGFSRLFGLDVGYLHRFGAKRKWAVRRCLYRSPAGAREQKRHNRARKIISSKSGLQRKIQIPDRTHAAGS
jgi:hypothetical protein